MIVLPYVARLAVGFLLETLDGALADTGSDIEVGQNIGTDATHDTYPFVRITQVGGSVISPEAHYWLGETLLQFDIWGPGGNDRFSSHTIAEVAAALMAQQLRGSVEYTIGTSSVSAVVNAVVVGGVTDHLDTDLTPARPMSRFDALVTAHPQPPSGA
jgi:hypothetical protein